MIYYRLEISKTKPTQFRITVVEGTPPKMRPIADIETLTWIGLYKTPEELTDALETYLLMEESRGTPA